MTRDGDPIADVLRAAQGYEHRPVPWWAGLLGAVALTMVIAAALAAAHAL